MGDDDGRSCAGRVVVDGVVCSNFAFFHSIPDCFYSPHRMLYRALDAVGATLSTMITLRPLPPLPLDRYQEMPELIRFQTDGNRKLSMHYDG